MRLPSIQCCCLLALLGCGPGDDGSGDSAAPEPTAPVVLSPGKVTAWSDVLHVGPVDGFAAAGGADVAASWEGASWRWSSTADPALLSLTEGPVTAAAQTSEGLWLVIDGELLLHDGVLREVGWSADLEGRVQALTATGDRLWLQTDAGLSTRSGGRLSTLTLDGAPITGPVAFGGAVDGIEVLWTAQDSLVVALDPLTGDVLEGVDLQAPVAALTVDGADRVHALAAGSVHVRTDGTWAPLLTEPPLDPVSDLRASPELAGTWLATEAGWLHHDVDRIDQVTGLDPLSSPAIDGLGRLLVSDAAGLHRHAARRPVELVGFDTSARIEAPQGFALVPTAPEQLTALTASLVRGDEVVPVPLQPDHTGQIDPLGLVFGRWELELVATHGSELSVTRWPLRMAAASGATWSEHVEPIYAERCSMCHDGASETVLVSRGDWELRIDAILENVTTGEMPLVGPSLDSSQIALIQAWAAGGFPE